MPVNLIQKVLFKNTSPKALYDLYMNAKKHSEVTGAAAKIQGKVGSQYSAHGGYITGKNLQLVRDKLIVQSWRASDWEQEDADSVFMIVLVPTGKDTVLHAVHTHVPDKQAASIDQGWHEYYWNPWKQFLAGKKNVKRKTM